MWAILTRLSLCSPLADDPHVETDVSATVYKLKELIPLMLLDTKVQGSIPCRQPSQWCCYKYIYIREPNEALILQWALCRWIHALVTSLGLCAGKGTHLPVQISLQDWDVSYFCTSWTIQSHFVVTSIALHNCQGHVLKLFRTVINGQLTAQTSPYVFVLFSLIDCRNTLCINIDGQSTKAPLNRHKGKEYL